MSLQIIRLGVQIDDDLEGIWRDTQFLTLPARTYRILSYLVAHRNQIVATSTLLHVGWPDEPREAQDLYRHIHRIRDIVEMNPHHPRWLITRKDSGYILFSPDRDSSQ
jgi:two-component system response regulator VicR